MEAYFNEINNNRYIDYTEDYFITYAVRDNDCVLEDIYIVPEKRGTGLLKDIIEKMVTKGKEHNCTYLVGTAKTNDATSIKGHIKTGFVFLKEENNIIYFVREL